MAAHLGFNDVHRTERGGVPVFWAPQPEGLPFVGMLVFRVGKLDETLRTSGVSHLVEHMALPGQVGGAVDYNGMVDVTSTTFWASGEQEDVLAFLVQVAERIVSLPVERLERERSILLTEAASRDVGHPGATLSLRFGARGPGLVAHDEIGLHWLAAEDVAEWAASRFVAENAAVCLTAAPPESFELPLLRGARLDAVLPDPVPDVTYPAVFAGGPDDSVAASILARRSTDMTIAMNVLNDRVRQRLRYGRGMTYEVGTWFEPLTAELAHHVIWADCLPENAAAARAALLTELDELAHTGPADEERTQELAEFDRWARDRSAIPSLVWSHAHAALIGMPLPSPHDLREARLRATRESVGEALAAATAELLLVQPERVPPAAGRYKPYPQEPRTTVAGRALGRAGLRFRRQGVERSLVLGEDGITLHGDGFVRTVLFDETEAVLVWADGSRTLCAADGTRVHIDPAIWKRGAAAVAWVDARAPAELRITMEPEDEALSDPDVAAAREAAERGDHERALRALERAVERWPDNASVAAMRAASLLASRQPAAALREAERALQLAPSDPWTLRLRTHALGELGRTRQALAAARETVGANPSDLEALTDLAWLASEAGAEAEARRAAQRAVELYPTASDAWFAEGWVALSAGDWQPAEQALRRAAELDPANAMWRNNLGWLFLSVGRTHDAFSAFNEALKLDADNVFARANRAHALRRLGRAGEAERAWRELHEGRLAQLGSEPDPIDPTAATDRVRSLVALGRDEEALAAARRGVEIHPEHAPLVRGAVFLEVLHGEVERAGRYVEALLAIDAADPDALWVAAWYAWIRRDLDAGRRIAHEAEQHDERARGVQLARGYALLTEKRPAEARSAFEQILRTSPLDCCAHAGAGLAALELGDEDAAARSATEADLSSASRCQDAQLLRERLAA